MQLQMQLFPENDLSCERVHTWKGLIMTSFRKQLFDRIAPFYWSKKDTPAAIQWCTRLWNRHSDEKYLIVSWQWLSLLDAFARKITKSRTLIVSHQKALCLTSQSKARNLQPVQLSQNNYRLLIQEASISYVSKKKAF